MVLNKNPMINHLIKEVIDKKCTIRFAITIAGTEVVKNNTEFLRAILGRDDCNAETALELFSQSGNKVELAYEIVSNKNIDTFKIQFLKEMFRHNNDFLYHFRSQRKEHFIEPIKKLISA
jgi:hypothetical protein